MTRPARGPRATLSALLCLAGLTLGSLCPALATVAPPRPVVGGEGALLVTATRVEADAPGLVPGDPEALAALLPGLAVGGVRELEVAGFVPRPPADFEPRVLAADPAWAALAGLRAAHGRELDTQDERAGAAVCLLSPRMARLLEPGKDRIKLDETWWTAVGVLAEPGDEAPAVDVLVPLRAGLLRMVPQEEARLDELRVAEADGQGALAARVSRALSDLHGGRGAWRVEGEEATWTGPKAALERAVRGLLVALGVCALVLGGMALRGWRAAGGPGIGASLGLGVAVGLGCVAVAMLAGAVLATALGLEGTIAPLGLVAAVVGPVVGVALAGVLGRRTVRAM